MKKVQLVKSSQSHTQGIPFNRRGEQDASLAEAGQLLAQVTGGQYGDGYWDPYMMGYGGMGYGFDGFGMPFPFFRPFPRRRIFCCICSSSPWSSPCDDSGGYGGY